MIDSFFPMISPIVSFSCSLIGGFLDIARIEIFGLVDRSAKIFLQGSVLQAKELSISLGWEISRLSHQITRMEKSGLVKREIYKEDSRSCRIKIIMHGKKSSRKPFRYRNWK